ncbi:hypothetical protein Micbo1qcDRAFT_179967 [Microdochium bolleyi]|uniref:Uncharacterized protein n=1 Tax=Microdochium bolleyi TaxID=196109 RepID=A0A136INL0_9PEZI|nr:hypothetical protein Micbo1qcDRAFT_179967 [Microdochium bolleyi]
MEDNGQDDNAAGANPDSGLDPDFLARYRAMSRSGGHKYHSAIRNPQPKVFEDGLFARLNWPLWEPLSGVKVLADESLVDGSADAPLQWKPLFDDALQPVHAIGSLPATNPPLSRMTVEIATIHDHDWWHDACLMDQRPAALVIDNSGGQQGEPDDPITIAQFVRKVAAYLETQPLRSAFEELFSPRHNEPANRAFYMSCSGPKRSQITTTGDGSSEAALFRLHFIYGWREAMMDDYWVRVRRRLLHCRGSRGSADVAV